MAFSYRILVVDDDEIIRIMATAVLNSQGYEVLCAVDGFDALAALKQSLPDLIISDLRMPKMSGFEFLSVVRHRFPHIPVIAISGEFTGFNVPESVLADMFLAKGQYTPDELFTRIAKLLHETPIRPRAGKNSKVPIWVSRSNSNYLMVTCTDCLRTFRVEQFEGGDVQHAQCNYCGTPVHFQVTEEVTAFMSKGAD